MQLDQTSHLIRRAGELAANYHRGLSERSVAPTAAALAALTEFDEPFPEHPADAEATLEMLDRVGSPATRPSAPGTAPPG